MCNNDAQCVASACEGVDVVVHLAGTPDDADFQTDILPNNVMGMHNLLRGAVAASVKRIVFASSMQVNWFQLVNAAASAPLISPSDPPSPRYWCAPPGPASTRARCSAVASEQPTVQQVCVGQAVLRRNRLRFRSHARHHLHRCSSRLVPSPRPAGKPSPA
jgi:hypothetical protein